MIALVAISSALLIAALVAAKAILGSPSTNNSYTAQKAVMTSGVDKAKFSKMMETKADQETIDLLASLPTWDVSQAREAIRLANKYGRKPEELFA